MDIESREVVRAAIVRLEGLGLARRDGNSPERTGCQSPRRGRPGSTKAVRPRLEQLARRDRNATWDAPTTVRIQLLDDHTAAIAELDAKEKVVTAKLNALVAEAGSTLEELCGLSTRSAAELLVEVGDPRRFTEGGFARFNGTAPLPASSGEGPGEPVRHRLNRGGNRRVNAVLHAWP